MRILLAGTFNGHGGVQVHLCGLARILADAGHEVYGVSLGVSPVDAGERQIIAAKFSGQKLIFVERSGLPGGTVVGGFCAVKRVLRCFQPHVYLACGTGWNLFAPAVLGWPRPWLIFHEVMSGEAGGWRDSRWLVRRGFNAVVAQAAPVARNFERTFSWPGTIPVLPALSEPLEVTARIPAVSTHRVECGTARAGFFSRLVPHKRAAWLVEQWPRLRGCLQELHLFGSGPEQEFIEDTINRHGWGDRVFCHGPYPAGQSHVDLLMSLDLTLLPTVGAEGAPLVLLESMACGVPFVATDAGGIADYANPDCLLSPWREPEKFLEAVIALTTKLHHKTLDQGRLQRFYRERFSFAALSARWLAFFETLS